MAVFRNLLVHRYGDVDNEVVLEVIKSELPGCDGVRAGGCAVCGMRRFRVGGGGRG